MPKGRVKSWDPGTNQGVVTVGGSDHRFSLSQWHGDSAPAAGMEADVQVAYNTVQRIEPRGAQPAARRNDPMDALAAMRATMGPAEPPSEEELAAEDADRIERQAAVEGFVNPYNFVPFHGVRSKRDRSDVDHSRFAEDSHSGYIRVRVTLLTPLSSPRSAKLPERGRGVQPPPGAGPFDKFHLLKDAEGRVVLPGSSFRGSIRSVAEVLAAGCVSQAALPDLTSWRPTAPALAGLLQSDRKVRVVDPVLIPTVLVQNNRIDGWTHGLAHGQKVWFRCKPMALRVRDRQRPFDQKERAGEAHESKGRWAFVEKTGVVHELLYNPRPNDPVAGWATIDHVVTAISVEEPNADGWIAGVLHVTRAPEGAAKKYQRIFPISDGAATYVVEPELIKAANEVAESVGHAHDRGAAPRWQRLSVLESHTITVPKNGELLPVWFRLDGQTVTSIGRVALHRLKRRNSPASLLSDAGFSPCDGKSWCWTCILFGPTHSARGDSTEDQRWFRSRVRFGELRTDSAVADDDVVRVRRAPLAEPHPDCDVFYLTSGQPAERVSFDDDGVYLRGRKFYLHQPLAANDQKPYEKRDGHTADFDRITPEVELLCPGRELAGTVRFWNLRDEDLGLLLASLDPTLIDDRRTLAHKFGGGKPLGLGSAKVTLERVVTIDRRKRYSSLIEDPALSERDLDRAEQQRLAACMAARLEKSMKEYVARPDVGALLDVLDFETVRGVSERDCVHYPPGHNDRTNEAFVRSYEWFKVYGVTGREWDPLRSVGEVRDADRQRMLPEGGRGRGGRPPRR